MLEPQSPLQSGIIYIKESKARQHRIIAQADNEISYAQSQITTQEGRKQQAEKLLAELETRYPTPIVETIEN